MKPHTFFPALAVWLTFFSFHSEAQIIPASVKISGTVKDQHNIAIPFASIRIQQTHDGATSDSLGHFSLQTQATGRQTLLVTSLGYKTYHTSLMIQQSAISLNIVLKKDQQQLQGVVISAGSFEASDKAKGASLTPMDAVTVAGSNADIATALRSLPGAQQIGEQAGLFVRGGTGEETKQFIDGMLLPHPNYPAIPGIAQPAHINPFLFSGILFSSGGYSALYGGAMSSALILQSVDLPDQSAASFSAFFPGNLSAGFQKIAKDQKSSYGINMDYSNQALYDKAIPQQPDYYHGPEYYTGDANFRWKTGKTGMLKMYVNWSIVDIGLRNPDIDSASLKSDYASKSNDLYTNISYRQYLNDRWKITAGAAYDFSKSDVELQLLGSHNHPIHIPEYPYADKNTHGITHSTFAQGRVVLTRMFNRNQSLDLGAEQFYTNDRYLHNDTASELTDQLSAIFAEGNIRISDRLAARVGARFEYSTLLGQATLAPRISLAYRVRTGAQINFAYGIFFQQPEDTYLFQDQGLQASRATHYVLNYTQKADNRFFRIEAYYKQYHDLIKTNPTFSNEGDGFARGIELFWRDKKTIKDLDYWISYTYLDTKRDYLNYPSTLRPTFSAPHTATLAVKKFFPDISTSVNVSYAFSAGRPYYDFHKALPDDGIILRDQGKTKAYSVANLHVAYLFNLFKKSKHPAFSGVAAGVNNLLGTRQVFGYHYSEDGKNKVPVTLPARQYFFLGFFTSLGVDRTSDFMDNNL